MPLAEGTQNRSTEKLQDINALQNAGNIVAMILQNQLFQVVFAFGNLHQTIGTIGNADYIPAATVGAFHHRSNDGV
jgi:hypothetical protein